MPEGISAGVAFIDMLPNFSKFGGAINRGIGRLASGFTSAGKKLTVGLTLPLLALGKKSLDAFEELDKATKRLQFGLAKMGQGRKKFLDPLLEWAKKFSLQTGIDDSDIVALTSKVTVFGRQFFKAMGPSAVKLIEQATEGITNLAAATGKSAALLLRSLLPSILNTPDKAVALLQKFGVLTAAQTERVKKLVKAGKASVATQLELTALQQRESGAAAKTATASERLHNAINQLEQEIGKFLLPYFEKLVRFATKISQKFEALSPHAKQLAIKIGLLAAALGPALLIFGKLIRTIQILQGSPILLLITLLAVLAALWLRNKKHMELARRVMDRIVTTLRNIWKAVQPVVLAFIRGIVPAFKVAVKHVTAFINKLLPGIHKILDVVIPLAQDLGHRFVPVLKALADVAVKNLLPALKNLWKAFLILWNGVLKYVVAALLLAALGAIKLATIVLPALIRVIGFLILAISKLVVFLARVASFIVAIIRVGIKLIIVVGKIIAWFVHLGARLIGIGVRIVAWYLLLPVRILQAIASLPGKIAGLFSKAKDKAIAVFKQVLDWLRSLPGKVGSALSGVVGAFTAPFRDARDKVVGFFEDIWRWIQKLLGAIPNLINKIPGIGLAKKGVGLLGKIGRFVTGGGAEGGIAMHPRVLSDFKFAERGPEAMVPLDRLEGWIEKVAGGRGTQRIVGSLELTPDGRAVIRGVVVSEMEARAANSRQIERMRRG